MASLPTFFSAQALEGATGPYPSVRLRPLSYTEASPPPPPAAVARSEFSGRGLRVDGHRILVAGEARRLARELESFGNIVHQAEQNARLQAGLTSGTWDGCVLDGEQLEAEGLDLVRHARETQPNLAVLVGGEDTAELRQLAVVAGADEFLDVAAKERMSARRVGLAIAFRRIKSRSHLTATACNVLVLDWDQVEAPAVRAALVKAGVAVSHAADPWTALRKLRTSQVDVLLTPPGATIGGASVAEAALRYDPRLRVVVTSDMPDLADAAGAVSAGACDYLLRPVGPQQAIGAVRRAWSEHADTRATGHSLPRQLRVLVVEPRAAYARLLEQMLGQDQRLWCISVGEVDQALARLAEREFDALVFSPDMHRSDSLLVMRQLRGRDPRPALVVMQESADSAFAERALRLGAQDVVLRRSLGRQALSERVRSAVMRNRHQLQHERFVRDLQTREASQQEVVRRSVDGLMIVDARGFVVFTNPAAEGMFGIASSELLGTQFPYDLSDDSPREVELRAGENPCAAEMTRVAIDWNGAPAHLVALRDVTERQQAQALRDRLAHTERLAAIGQLAAGVAHEINNPAAYVVANLEAMRQLVDDMEASKGDSRAMIGEFRQMLDENLEGMARIRSITGELRNFARIDRSEVDEVCLDKCVLVACKLAFNEIRHRARLVQELGSPPPLVASQGKLAQVVTNLLVNAAQAIPEGDTDAHRITVRTGADTDSVWLVVEDTGRGIPEPVRAQMFDPFFTTKTRTQGTGLGLALCADIVRQHNGELIASNRPQGGARLEMRLPLQTGLRKRPPAVRALNSVVLNKRPPQRHRVLLIDDEPLVLRSLKRLLVGHEVDVARSGPEGLELLAGATHYDVIFCDLMMPEMDGAAVFSEIESRFPERVRHVVFCSGGVFTKRTKELVERSCRPLVEKPLTLEAFESVFASFAAPVDLPVDLPGERRAG